MTDRQLKTTLYPDWLYVVFYVYFFLYKYSSSFPGAATETYVFPLRRFDSCQNTRRNY